MTGTTSRDLWKPFWGAHQRFFKLLCISLKVQGLMLAVQAEPSRPSVLDAQCGACRRWDAARVSTAGLCSALP